MPAAKGYLKAWRKAHPHYERDRARQTRGCTPGEIGRKAMRKVILGVAVNWKWVSR